METLSLQYNATTILLLLSSSILLTIELKSTRLAAARQRQTGEEAVTYGEGEACEPSASELVRRALRMIVGTDLIKMIDPRAILRYKMFFEAGLAANIAAAVVKLSLPKKMSSSWEDVGVAVASMVLATFSMFDKLENVFLITFTGAPCFPISAIASPNSPTVETNFCRIPATLSTLDDGIFNAATGG
nr:hypothetical protein Iba_scaffold8941CG0080 [Ipomoea batatas]